MKINLVIDHTGKVAVLSLDKASAHREGLYDCLKKVFAAVVFPASDKGVRVPVALTLSGK